MFLNHQKSTCGVNGIVCLVFLAKELLHLLSIWYQSMENLKRSLIHLVLVFISITNMAGYYVFITKKQLVDLLVIFAWCFKLNHCVFIFNMLLVNGKLFSRSQKDLKIIYNDPFIFHRLKTYLICISGNLYIIINMKQTVFP